MVFNEGYSAAKRILPIVDTENIIEDRTNATDLNISKGNIYFFVCRYINS